MKKGLIVYQKEDQEKNIWFIDKCIEGLNDNHFSLLYKEESETLSYINDHQIDFVIYRGRDYTLAKKLEERGIKVFNNSLTNKVANDKYETFLLCLRNSIKRLHIYQRVEHVDRFPCVMKSINGHGGQEVFLVNSLDDVTTLRKQMNRKFIYQEYLPHSQDVRLYVLNKKVIGAVKRSNPHDFRSNFSLGGEVSFYLPSQEMIDTAVKAANILDADFIGVDFLINDKDCYLNEIEDPVGSRMLYKTSDIDIVSLYIEHIKEVLSH